jgi:hypothetical protein
MLSGVQEGKRSVDGKPCDVMNKSLAVRSRRTILGLVLGSGLAGLIAPADAAKNRKRKKKCKRPSVRCSKTCCVKGECLFNVKGKRWLLQADCPITRTIQIPKGITVDGQGHTISMAGAKTGYAGAGLVAVAGAAGGRANVVNLTIDAAGLTGPCAVNGSDPLDPAAILFGQTSGRIEGVTIVNITCTGAIVATVSDSRVDHTIEVVNTRVTATPPADRAGVGINVGANGPSRLIANIVNSEFTSAAVLFNTNVDGTVDDCTFTAGFIGGLHGANVTVKDTTMTNAVVGISVEGAGSTLTATGNTIVGPDDDMNLLITGIDFRPGSSGSVNGNAISNYVVDGPCEGCGIRVDPGAGDVAIGTNSFPPPANERDICLPA